MTSAALLPRASVADTLGVVAEVLAPTLAKGALLRRPRAVGAAERLGLDARAVRRLQRLRARYGEGPVLLASPGGREQAVALAAADVRQVLDHAPEPFHPASPEKRSALGHFQPDGVLATRGPERAARRAYNDAVLDSRCPRHRLAAHFDAVAAEELGALAAAARAAGRLAWDDFAPAWWRAVRRVVLGDGARDDSALTDLLQGLRADANWAFLALRRLAVRDRFEARLAAHLARAEPASLAGVMAATPAGPDARPAGQVPQWLFAFDAAGISAFRALALLAAHPAYRAQALGEVDGGVSAERPLLRAAVLEAVRLWPTTPMILRQTTAETRWAHGVMPAGTGVLLFVPFLHRDDERLPFADRFAPELWLDSAEPEAVAREWPLVPFSAGPAVCPGRHLALLLAGAAVGALLGAGFGQRADPARLDGARPLPGSLDNYTLAFAAGA